MTDEEIVIEAFSERIKHKLIRLEKLEKARSDSSLNEEIVTLRAVIVGEERLLHVMKEQHKVLSILKKHANKIAEFPGQEKEPDIQIIVMPEADEEYETIMKWLEEK